MDLNKSGLEFSRKLLTILENLLAENKDYWESSLFLSKVQKRLCQLRDDTKLVITEMNENPTFLLSGYDKKKTVGMVKVYVYLYQVDGDNLLTWMHTLRSLAMYNVTRPTYKNEEHVKELIGSKVDSNAKRHGYAEILVKSTDIISMEPVLTDALGHEMLILKEGGISVANIVSFVHANLKKYAIQNNELVFLSDINL